MKNKTPNISIIIPTYNNEHQISECLNSLLEQNDEIYEVVVINDGSTDNTENVVKEISGRNKKVRLISTPNHGVSHARNLGVKEAKGDYITFVDADDYLKNNAISTIKKILTDNNYPDFIRYNFEEFGGKRFSNNLYGLDCGVMHVQDNIARINQHLLCNKEPIPNLCQLLVINAKIAKRISFREGIAYLEDQLYYQSLLGHSETCIFEDYKGYNLRTNNSSSSMNPSRVALNINSLDEVNRILNKEIPQFSSLINKTHFQLMLGKIMQIPRQDNKIALAILSSNSCINLSRTYINSHAELNDLKIIAQLISKRHKTLAYYIIRIRLLFSKIKGLKK